MNAAWLTIVLLAAATLVVKAAAPLLLGGRPLPSRLLAVVALLASTLLGALVVVGTFGAGRALQIDARAAGMGVAVLILLRRRDALLPAVIAAAAVTAAVRAF